MSRAVEAFEREMWPKGPAHGSGSGIWAKHRDRIIEAAATAERARGELARLREALGHIRGLASGEGGDEASRNDPHNALTTIVLVCDEVVQHTEEETPDSMHAHPRYGGPD